MSPLLERRIAGSDWEQVEAFIQTSTGQALTHGYCPVCFEAARREIQAWPERP